MYTLIILTILCLVEAIFVYSKWSDIKEYQEVASGILKLTNVHNTQFIQQQLSGIKKFTFKVVIFASRFKKLLLIPIIILFVINFIISVILGSILGLIF